MSEFRMPSLGSDMEAGTLVEWMKQPGDAVKRGDIIAAVETQKGAIEIECYEDGVLQEYRVGIGEKVPVGTVLAIIRSANEAAAEPATATVPMPVPMPVAMPEPPAAATPVVARPVAPPPTPAEAATLASPAARQRAAELGIDLAKIPVGAGGVIGLREVEAMAAQAMPNAAAETTPRQPAAMDNAGMRAAIAAAMSRSWREIPHYVVASTVDAEPLLRWLSATNAARPVPERLLYAAPLIKAVALALQAVPSMNGHYLDGRFVPSPSVHLGIAIAMRGGGLIAPALLDAHALPLVEIMAKLTDLVARVRGGRLRSAEMSMATATLSNLGEHSADRVQGVIYPPQVAIIGCGQIRERVWAEAGATSVRRSLEVSVSGDHRVSDGRTATRFLARLAELLADPEAL